MWDDESFLSNRNYRVGRVGLEVPDKVGYMRCGQITKDSEASKHKVENELQCQRRQASKLMGGCQEALEGEGHWRRDTQ